MSGPINLFWYSSVAVQLLFCIHLVWTRLAKNYPIFTLYLGCSVAGSLAAMFFMRGAMGARLPLSYTYFWLWTEPVLLLLQIAVALEVHARMWTEHSAMVRPAKPLLSVPFFRLPRPKFLMQLEDFAMACAPKHVRFSSAHEHTTNLGAARAGTVQYRGYQCALQPADRSGSTRDRHRWTTGASLSR